MHFTKNIFSLSVFFLLMAACNPSNRLNQAVEKKKEQEVTVQFPQQHINTPDNINFVYDYEQLYTTSERLKIDSLLRMFEKSNLIAIKLVTLSSTNMQAPDFDANNALLYKEWDKVHGGSGKVMVLSISRQLEKAKADYGPFVAKLLSEREVANVIEANRPIMERGDFFTATWNGLNQLMDTVRKNIK